MPLLEVLQKLRQLEVSVFQTSDAAAYLKINRAHASKLLGRLAKTDHLIPLKKGLWAFPNRIEAIQLPHYLVAPLPCYISLQTALYYHGMIDQIPVVIYAVSLARTQKITTPLGTVSIHNMDADFFFGFEKEEKTGIFMACPEKALVDILYLSPARSGIFRSLPELELPPEFSKQHALDMIAKIPFKKRQKMVRERMDQFINL